MAVNLAHAQLRRRLLTADKMHRVEQSMGREAAERFADSGITGVTPGKVSAPSLLNIATKIHQRTDRHGF